MARARATLGRLTGDLSADVLLGLLLPDRHSLLVRQRRAGLIVSRVRLIATTFAVLTPLWIVIDLMVFPWPLWGWLAALRLMASAAFAMVAIGCGNTEDVGRALRLLGFLQVIPTLFFMGSLALLNQYPHEGMAGTMAAGYEFLPYVMVVGLSVFPITLVEGVLFSAPMMLAMLSTVLADYSTLPFNSFVGAIWLLMLLSVAATVSGMSQLHFMGALVNQSAHDLLTKAYTRRVGAELLDLMFVACARSGKPITVAFFDLDDFKSVNDRFGHEEGDKTLRLAAEMLRAALRRNDLLVRWGGEEFLVIMPFTDCAGAQVALRRLCLGGLGVRPDNKRQSASVGIADSLADASGSWQALVERADRRMYLAKQRGKDQVVACGDETIVCNDEEPVTPPGKDHRHRAWTE